MIRRDNRNNSNSPVAKDNNISNTKKRQGQGIKAQMLSLALIPLLLLAVIVGLVSVNRISNKLFDKEEETLRAICNQLMTLYDSNYPGDFSVEIVSDSTGNGDKSNAYYLYKGVVDITLANAMMDSVADNFGYDVSIFQRKTVDNKTDKGEGSYEVNRQTVDICVATTMKDADGNRMVLTGAADQITRAVTEKGDEQFYSNVFINGKECFAYFAPIVNADGSLFGVIGITSPRESTESYVGTIALPIIFTILLATAIIAAISIYFAEKNIKKIQLLQRFMNALASGRFDNKMSENLLSTKDEFGDLAKDSVATQAALSKLVEYDALTNLHNRRYGSMKLDEIKEDAAATGKGYSIGMCDIDFFKKVNDTYGHDAGDDVLRAVAKVLSDNITGKGLVARWGGEEFVIAFDKLDYMQVAELLKDMAHQIRALEVPAGDQIIKVTMSMGCVQADINATWDEMLKEADELLYYSKEHGRNQINIKDCTKPDAELVTYEKGTPRS